MSLLIIKIIELIKILSCIFYCLEILFRLDSSI